MELQQYFSENLLFSVYFYLLKLFKYKKNSHGITYTYK